MHLVFVMLAALEMAGHLCFSPATADTCMDYSHPLNQTLFIALFKQTQVGTLSLGPTPSLLAHPNAALLGLLFLVHIPLTVVATAKLHFWNFTAMS